MDSYTTALHALRAKLKALSRKQVHEIADAAGVARSTAEKIRLDHIAEPRATKVERLAKALAEAEDSQRAALTQ